MFQSSVSFPRLGSVLVSFFSDHGSSFISLLLARQCIKRSAEPCSASVDSTPSETEMSDQNVRNAGFTSSGIRGGSLASSMMSQEARASGGGVHSGGPTSTLQQMGMSNFVCLWFCGSGHREKQLIFFLENQLAN